MEREKDEQAVRTAIKQESYHNFKQGNQLAENFQRKKTIALAWS